MFTKCISSLYMLIASLLIATAVFYPQSIFAQLDANDAATRTSIKVPSIIGGSEVQPVGKYPFMVAISRKGLIDFHNTYQGHECGGSLIHPMWVLTAAHCFYEKGTNKQVLFESNTRVTINRHNLKSSDGEEFSVSKIIIHPLYSNLNKDGVDDIALVQLAKSSSYPTISVADASQTELTVQGVGIVIGWGQTDASSSISAVLKENTLPFVSQVECNNFLTSVGFSPLSNQFCVGYQATENGSTCGGDSGGPIFVPLINNSEQSPEEAAWLQLGIIHGGFNSCTSYNIMTDVRSYSAWIQEQLRADGQFVHFAGDCTAFSGPDAVIAFEHPDCKGRFEQTDQGAVMRPFQFEPAAYYIGSQRSILIEDGAGNSVCATRSLYNTHTDYLNPTPGIRVYGNTNRYTVYKDNTCGGKDLNKNGVVDSI